jgi:branched-chain amino acid transport system substrate-binding protein
MKAKIAGLGLAAGLVLGPAHAEDVIKIAVIDPLSGGGAAVGTLKEFEYLADEINASGGLNGKKVEIIGLDNKGSPQESLVQAQKAADDGVHIITQGPSSLIAAAVSDWVTKYNDHNPGKEVIYLNYGAGDPALTNAKCSYWHFLLNANVNVKVAALTEFLKTRPNVMKVYLIDQDYSVGQLLRTQTRAMLKEKRPDIEIVGDDVHLLLKITDFAPYVAKIKDSGADSVITGNWGSDDTLLLKAAADAGLKTDWYMYYGGFPGDPAAMKQGGLPDRVFAIFGSVTTSEPAAALKLETDFRAKNGTWLPSSAVVNEMRMLAKGIAEAKSDDAKAVAARLEGMTVETLAGGEASMRADDHQLFQDLYVVSHGPLDPGSKFDEENTGWGWKTVSVVNGKDTVLPTTCKMNRPLPQN